MKTSTFLITILVVLLGFNSSAQIQFWSDDFEDTGSPSSGSRTPSVEFSCNSPASSYFFRSAPSGLALQSGSYTSFSGSKVWGGEDIDMGPTCSSNSISPNEQVTWSGINISGKSGLSFSGLFAANGVNGGWEGSNFGANQDFMAVEYRIDGGTWTKIIGFYAGAITSTSTLSLDNNGDLIGDGTALSYTFTEFSASIPGSGTTLDLRFNCSSNGTASEEFAIDNFRLFEAPSCTAPSITSNPPNRSICAGNNTTFGITATGATAFQWQVDQGSGFNDISNGGVYSNATTNTLTITGATGAMNGYLYRCVAMNGSASCFTNSNSGTLVVSAISTSSGAQSNVSCNGGTDGAAAITPSGGVTPYSYSWSPSGGSGSIATGLAAGTYTVTVTDNIGCTATRNYTITQPPVLALTANSQTDVACNGFSNGTASVNIATGGAGGYTYNWTPGNPTGDGTTTVTGLSAGTWTCTVTDNNACTASVNFTITQPTALALTANSQTNIACNGGTTGAASVSAATGGAGGYTYNWTPGNPTGDGTTSVTGLSAGTWTCTVTDNNACTASVNFTITQPTALALTANSQTNIACNGNATGAASVNIATGGTGTYTYNWTPGNPTGDGTTSVTGLSAGTWACTVTDANACTASVNFTITQPTALALTANSQTDVSCNGLSNGTASVNIATGGTGTYTYNWTPGNPTGDGTTAVTGLSAGTWTCTVTDANACTASVNFTITQPTALALTASSQTDLACNGLSTGAATVNDVTGGTGTYTYNWTPGNPTGDGTTSVTGLSAGTWTCTVTDANACTASVNFTITQPTALALTANSQTDVACNGGSNGAAAVNAATGGAGTYTYNWTPGNPTGDGTTSVTGLSAGTWTCTVTDANACTASVNFTITQPTALALTANSQTDVACNGGSNGAATVNVATGGAGTYTYNWTPGNPTGDGTTSVTGLSAGTWTCTVTDANACTASVNFTITEPTTLALTASSQTDVSCNGGANGTATVSDATGGTGTYTYNWTPGNPTGDGTTSVTGLSAGTWTCTVTDANACTASVNFTITEPTALALTASSQTDVSCNGLSTGAATVNDATGGTGTYTYNWTPGNPTGDGTTSVTGLSAGTWTCTVTDANACTASVNFTITQPTALALTASSQTDVACNGLSTGAATVNDATGGTGTYTYDWTPGNPTGDGTTTVTGLSAGTWTCTVTDANACTASVNFTITEPTALALTANSQTDVACNGGSNGAATVDVATGGAGTYTYDWTPGNPTGDGTTSVTGLSAGTWTCTVTDANACTASVNFTITEPTALALTANSQTDVACNGGSNGAATVDVATGGTGTYTYDWTPGNPTGDGTTSVTGLSAGTWTCTVTDANACTASVNFTITEPTALALTASSQTDVSCNGLSTGAATVNDATGGTGTYTYDWTPGNPTGDGTTSVTGLSAGTWTCTVTDANACTASVNFTITEPAAITGTDSQTACDSYTWGSQTYTTSGVYTQSFPAANGCDSTVTLTLTINNATSSSVTETACSSYYWAQNGATYFTSGAYTDTIPNMNGCDSVITLNLTIIPVLTSTVTQTACDSFTWSQNNMTYLVSGQYNDTITSSLGCDSIVTLDLTINASPVATATDNGDGTITASAGGTYEWIDCATNTPIQGASSQTFAPSVDGDYAVIITDGNCSDTSDCVTIDYLGLSSNQFSKWNVYPNPANSSVTVSFEGTSATLFIYDASGKTVWNGTIADNELISLDGLERGLYIFELQTANQTGIKRVVKN